MGISISKLVVDGFGIFIISPWNLVRSYRSLEIEVTENHLMIFIWYVLNFNGRTRRTYEPR